MHELFQQEQALDLLLAIKFLDLFRISGTKLPEFVQESGLGRTLNCSESP
jgi:hypothetical protein